MKKSHVILLHGLHQRHWLMKPLAKRLAKAEFITHTFDYPTLFNNIEENADKLHQFLIKKIGTEKFYLVAHSLGGLVIRQMLAQYPQWLENGQLQKVVTLGTPHLGSAKAKYAKKLLPPIIGKSYHGALDGQMAELPNNICLGVIAGNKPYPLGVGQLMLRHHDKKADKENAEHDGTVYVSETLLNNASDHIILPVTHMGMLLDKQVAEQTLYFLQNGEFKR